jgi:putative addiction module component (TIGR02574 family)
MTAAVEQLKTVAEALSAAERADLAQFLLSTLTPEPTGGNDAWRAEIDRRVADIRAGRVTGRPMDEVLAELRVQYP